MRGVGLVAALSAATVGLVLTASTVLAGEHWKFDVVNKSTVAAVEFRTQESGEWSSNWIKDRMEPGDKFNMDFGTDKGDCTVRTQIHFTDGTFFDADVDYCKVSTLYIFDKKLTWE
ncbi:MAG TPA: hypothetical protein VGY52_14490 [Roseiarcus sp.]|jgi:hypothetical protein|nr:hypothetical protein [Roseiarcus sp.]